MGKPEFDVISYFSDKANKRKDFLDKKSAIEVLRGIISGEISSVEVGADFLHLKLVDGRVFNWKMNSEEDNNFTVLTHTGYYEKLLSELMPHLVTNDSIVIDIGANKGWFTILLGKLVSGGSVFAFEPEKSAFEELLQNINLNNLKNVYPLQMALSDYTGRGAMEVPYNHSPLAYLINDKLGNERGSIEVNILDDFVEQMKISKVDLIKIDAEGSEYNILLGAQQILSATVAPMLIVEAFDKTLSRYAANVNKMIDYLQSFGYRVFDVETGIEYCADNRKKEYDTDLLCVKEDCIPAIHFFIRR